MDFEKLSAERYSLRKFDTRPVEQEKLDLILEAGRNAPPPITISPSGSSCSGAPRLWKRQTPAWTATSTPLWSSV